MVYQNTIPAQLIQWLISSMTKVFDQQEKIKMKMCILENNTLNTLKTFNDIHNQFVVTLHLCTRYDQKNQSLIIKTLLEIKLIFQ